MMAETMFQFDPRTAERIARITPAQRECLTLVLQHKTSKEIGQLLAISSHAVDKRLKTVLQMLGVDSRVEAALLLRAYSDIDPGYQRLVYPSPDLSPEPAPPSVEPRPNEWSDERAPAASYQIRDHDVASDWIAVASAVHGSTQMPRPPAATWPRPWGYENTLTIGQRVVAILMIAIFSALAFGAILASLDALRHLL